MRQITLSLAIIALAACGTESEQEIGSLGFVEGVYGGVATDEPRSALIGRDVLLAGGHAVDAATAMYFTLAVTLPSQASLGGGGVCIVADPRKQEVRVLDFLAREPSAQSQSGDRPSAVPGAVRGMFALHGRYGRVPWGQLVAPAERLARFGTRTSRALSTDLRTVEGALLADPNFRQIFGDPNTRRLSAEGDPIIQLDLAAVLSRIRVEGPGSLYAGVFASKFIEAVAEAGGSLSRTDLEGYRPVWREPIEVPMGDDVAYFSPPPTLGGVVAANMWSMLLGEARFEETAVDVRPHLLIEVERRAFALRDGWKNKAVDGQDSQIALDADGLRRMLATYRDDAATPAAGGQSRQPAPENPAAATLVAVDRDGSAVACGYTLNSLFGTGRIAPGTGIVLASVPGPGGRGATALGPMLVINPVNGTFYLAGAASGGAAAPAALVNTAARTLISGEALHSAIAARRVHGSGDVAFAENGLDASQREALRQRGHDLAETTELGRVNAIACPDGLIKDDVRCTVATDPRGYGLAIGFDPPNAVKR